MTGSASMRVMLAVMVLALVPALAAAQGLRTDVTVTPPDVHFDPPTYLDFDTEWVQKTVIVTLTPQHRNRQSWQLRLHALASEMGAGKPVGDIVVSVRGSDFTLSTAEQVVAEGTGDDSLTVTFRLRLRWTQDAAGFYSVPFRFTTTTL